MSAAKRDLQDALPFAMEPVVLDFSINNPGTVSDLLEHDDALLPPGYYSMVLPSLLRTDSRELPASKRTELDRFGAACRRKPELSGMVQTLFDRLFPATHQRSEAQLLRALLQENGFDPDQHEQIRSDLKTGRIGLAQNRIPSSSQITDVDETDVIETASATTKEDLRRGLDALAHGAAAVVTLAAGVGPLDARRRRSEGAASVLQIRWSASHLPGSASREKQASQ
jgi:hypothetical protein